MTRSRMRRRRRRYRSPRRSGYRGCLRDRSRRWRVTRRPRRRGSARCLASRHLVTRSSPLIEIVERSGLRGRGGSGFPTAVKMRAVADGPRRPDRRGERLGRRAGQHEGRVSSCRGARTSFSTASCSRPRPWAPTRCIVAVDRSRRQASSGAVGARDRRTACRRTRTSIDHAARRPPEPVRRRRGERACSLGQRRRREADVRAAAAVRRGACGAGPRSFRTSRRSAHLALIARFGADWFRAIGHRHRARHARSLTVGGAVASPGVCEIAIGTTLGDARAGGRRARPRNVGLPHWWLLRHVDTGGPRLGPARSGTWSCSRAGAAFGCGVVYALPARGCGLRRPRGWRVTSPRRAPASAARASTGSPRSRTRSTASWRGRRS